MEHLGCAVVCARNCGYAPMDDLGCAVNHVLSCHGFSFLLIFFRSLLGYLKDCNVAAHSVDSDIFYVVNLRVPSSVKLWCVN